MLKVSCILRGKWSFRSVGLSSKETFCSISIRKATKSRLGFCYLKDVRTKFLKKILCFFINDLHWFAGTVELSDSDEESQQYCFQLVFHGENNRTYYMGASSQNEMEGWMKSLTCVRSRKFLQKSDNSCWFAFRRATITWNWWCPNFKGSLRKSIVGTKVTRQKQLHLKPHRGNDKTRLTNLQAQTVTVQIHHQVCA